MAKELYNTPNLDELENGPWPSFVTGLKRLAQDDWLNIDQLSQQRHGLH